MKKDIIIAGVGGQGILSIAAVIGLAAINTGMHMKQSEVHGMSQRGGDVQSNLRISTQPIFSDLIPVGRADLIIAMEPMEALRYRSYLSEKGWVIASINSVENIPNYPSIDSIKNELVSNSQAILCNAESLARECGSVKASNMVLLGAAFPYMGLGKLIVEESINQIFAKKGQAIIDLNIKAFHLGIAYSNTNDPLKVS